MSGQVSTRIFEKRRPKNFCESAPQLVTRLGAREQKSFAELFFRKATAFFSSTSIAITLTCEIDIEQTWESFHAHAIPENIEIHPGDTILVHDVPTDVAFGGTYTGTRSATLIRAGIFRRVMTRMSGFLELTELFEVGFDPIDKKG